MTKKERQKVFDKYGGKCSYCGCELQKGWHVDEIEPIRRFEKYVKDETGNRIYDSIKNKWVTESAMVHPERFCLENQNPACASCNINKHSDSLEGFRQAIAKYVESLNLYSTQYKIAKRFGLVQETKNPVLFYFETIVPLPEPPKP